MPERSNGTDSRSVGLYLRGFESSFPHMITLVHLIFDILLWLLIRKLILVNYLDLLLILIISFIDLDHLRAKPIFVAERNSFKTHPFHKKWKALSVVAILLLFIRPIMFLGLGILSHFLLDHIYSNLQKRKKNP